MLPQSIPPLLSLKVRRTADEIIAMNTSEGSSISISPGPTLRPPAESIAAQARELQNMQDLVEQQCFAVAAALNTISDERHAQSRVIAEFSARAQQIEARLGDLSDALFNRVREMHRRIDAISLVLTPKPTFRALSASNEFSRITGISVRDDWLAVTTAGGYLVVMDRVTLAVIRASRPIPSESLFCPTFIGRSASAALFAVASSRRLLLASGFRNEPALCIDEGCVECFAAADEMAMRVGCDIATGEGQTVVFYQIDAELGKLKSIGATKPLRGCVNQIAIDGENLAVYALTAKRMFYSISATTFQTVGQLQFTTQVMQLALTGLFIVVSCAPNDIVLLTREREKFRELARVSINAGLRRFCCSAKALFVITKGQALEKRELSHPDHPDRICEPEAADYDPREYIGSVFARENEIYLSHGSRVSSWS
jgi:hypothetical protein